MVNILSKKSEFINGLIENAGWKKSQAEIHFDTYAPNFEIIDEVDFIINETNRLKDIYKKINIIPLFYNVYDNLLYKINI